MHRVLKNTQNVDIVSSINGIYNFTKTNAFSLVKVPKKYLKCYIHLKELYPYNIMLFKKNSV